MNKKKMPRSYRIWLIKYQRIQWLTKRIEELRKKIIKQRLGLIVLAMFICGCAISHELKAEKLRKEELLRLPKQEKEIILQSFSNSGIILQSFEKLGYSIFDIAAFLNEYKKNDIDGFCEFLKTKYPFNTKFEWWLDREIFDVIKRNYELLKKINEGRDYDKH